MTSMLTIWRIACFESRLLMRTWRFWVLSILCLLIAAVSNLNYTVQHWFLSGLSGSTGGISQGFGVAMQYTILAVVYSMAAVWFAFDFYHKDRAARVHEVLYSRPVSNGELVLGKYVGVLIPMVLLSVLLAVLTMLSRLLPGPFRGPLDPETHAVFLGLHALPALFFVMAFVFALVSATRSRALGVVLTYAFIIGVGGYIGMFQQVLSADHNALVDYMGSGNAWQKSDLIGFPDLGVFALQRLYVGSWIAVFLAVAVLAFPRKSGGRAFPAKPVAVLAVAAVGILAFVQYTIARSHRIDTLRVEARAEQKALAGHPRVRAIEYDIKVRFPGRRGLRAEALITIKNDNQGPMAEAPFTLNAGLKVDSVGRPGGAPLEYRRGRTVLVVRFNPPLAAGESAVIAVAYHGGIDPDAVFLGSKFEPRDLKGRQRGTLMFTLGFMPAYIGRYTFLLSETQWYPVANVRYGYAAPETPPTDFFRAKVEAEVADGRTAVSVGKLVQEAASGNGRKTVVWQCDSPVPGIPLLCGPYEKRSAVAGGIKFNVYYDARHRKNVEFFDDAAAALVDEIGSRVKQYTDNTGLAYPHPEFSAVEVPFPVRAYGEGWAAPNLLSQPGMALLKESSFFTADFGFRFKNMKRQAEKANEDSGAGALKVKQISGYFLLDLTGGQIEHSFVKNLWEYRLRARGPMAPLLDYSTGAFTALQATGSLPFHSVYLGSRLQEVIGRAVPAVVQKAQRSAGKGKRASAAFEQEARTLFIRATMNQDDLMEAMEKEALPDMDPEADPELYFNVMTVKGTAFIQTLSNVLGDRFPVVLKALMDKHQGGEYTLEEFRSGIEAGNPQGVSPLFDQWLRSTKLPGFQIVSKTMYRVKSDDPAPRYQVLARIRNSEDASGWGTLTVTSDEDTVTRVLSFAPLEEKQVGIVMPNRPESIRFTPVLSRNYDPLEERLKVSEEKPDRIDGVESFPYTPADEGVIVDDVDPSFSVAAPVKPGGFQRFRLGRKLKPGAYPEFDGFHTPSRWSTWRSGDAYGRFSHALKIKKAGTGADPAKWTATVPRRAQYEVLVFLGVDNDSFHRRRGQKLEPTFRYTIRTADGNETATLDTGAAELGWNSLGKFYFEPGTPAEITLSDEGKNIIVADAVWLRPVAP